MTDSSARHDLERGMALHRGGELSEAMECYRSLLHGACALDALVNLGAALDERGESEEAAAHYRRALALSPGHPVALYNLGNALMKLGRYTEAAQSFRRSLASSPGSREARLALGAALQAEGDLEGALALFRAAVADDPECADAHWYLALALLTAGELPQGWEEYEWRWRKDSFTSVRRDFRAPLWDGSPLCGRRILLHGEQGLGDTIHFIRYAPLVAAAGGTVLAECQHPALRPLLERVAGVTEVAVLGEPLPPFEVQIPLLSLPRVFGTTLQSVPAEVPYLTSDPERLSAWRARLSGDGSFKVGVAWAGKPFPDPFRSCSAADLAPLASVPGVSLYSLQLGERGGSAGFPLTDHTGKIGDFGDTAALISLLDLVVSVDTSVAHLAGALGTPVFLLLPKACDWRWLRGRDDSPWYPTMRLFRQQEQGEWGEVFRAVAQALKETVWGALEMAAQREPRSADRLLACGEFLAEEGRDREACARFMKAATLDPDRWQILYSLGVSFLRMGLLDQARGSFSEGAAVAPGVPLLHEGVGVVLQMQGDLPGACASYRRALDIDPGALRSLYNLGTACRELALFGEALQAFERVVALAPAHADARWNRAVLLLMHGELSRGWGEFHWRFRKSTGAPPARYREDPRWDGSPLAGRTILLHAEQGLGDTVHFCRYVPLVAERGGRVLLEVQSASLRPLLERLPGVARLLSPGEPVPPFDLHASLMDLPALFGTTLETVPPAPYLAADEGVKELWRRRVGAEGSFRVGLVWSGSPGHENDANRSLPLQGLAPLAGIPGVVFYSLQLGEGAAQGGDPPFPLRDLTGEIRDFADTAALVANLDLVITVDTCVAHLSGALGVPVWVLVPLVPDWRWLLDREDSPWYPAMRLFRQKGRGAWEEVLLRVRRALCAHLDRERAAHRHKARGVALAGEGRHREAAEAFEAALVLNPLDPESFNNLGSALAGEGRHREAVARYLKAIALNGSFVAPHYNMGNALKTLGRYREAIESYRRALELEPRLAQGWHNLGLALHAAGAGEEARRALEQALAVDPDYLAALHTLGEFLHDAGELEGAQEAFRGVLERDPCYLPSLNALGIALQTAGRPEEAVGCYLRALALKPDYLHALNNLGASYRSLGALSEAEGCYRAVMALDPGYADAYWNLSLVLLHLGRYEEGWRLYEWRFAKVEPIECRELPCPAWDGSPLAGRTILLHGEQGFGDTIQFARYATVVAALGGKVYLECQVPALKALLSTVAGVAGVLARGEILPPCHLHASLMSLPHLCGTTLATIPAQIPYLSVDPERQRVWAGRVTGSGVKVGLVWAGRTTYKDNKKRSLDLSLFAPLARVTGASFYMLQMGDGAEQGSSPPEGVQLHDLTGGIRSFADTAAFVANLDLVISADTAVAHLAGALGRPVWVLLPYACDWRWLAGREDSPWYPTVRLFRQRAPGDWPGVLDRVAHELGGLAGSPLTEEL